MVSKRNRVNRNASPSNRNILSKFRNRFSKRGDLNFGETKVDNDLTDGERFALYAIDKNKVNEIREILSNRKNDTEKDDQEYEEICEQLEDFERTIKVELIRKDIINMKTTINSILKEVLKYYEELTDCLSDVVKNQAKIEELTKKINQKLTTEIITPTGFKTASFASCSKNLSSLQTEYSRETKKPYEDSINIEYFSAKMAKDFYGQLTTKVYELEAEINNDSSKETDYRSIINKLNKARNNLSYLVKNPTEFTKFQQTIDESLKEKFQSLKPKSEDKDLARKKIGYRVSYKNKYEKYAKIKKDLLLNFKSEDEELRKAKEDLNVLHNNESELDEATKKEIENEVISGVDFEIFPSNDKEVYKFLNNNVDKLNQVLDRLAKAKYNTEEFKQASENANQYIKKLINEGKKANVKVSYEEYTLKIELPNNLAKPFERQIISNETIKAINDAKIANDKKNTEKELDAALTTLCDTIDFQAVYDEVFVKLDNRNLNKIYDKIEKLFTEKRFDILTHEEKKNVLYNNQSYKDAKSCAIKKYGEDLFETITNKLVPLIGVKEYKISDQEIIVGLDAMINKLNSLEVGTREFIEIYNKIIDSIKELKESLAKDDQVKSSIESIEFDENTCTLSINYVNKNVSSYKRQIVSKENLDKFNESRKTKLTPSGGQQPESSGESNPLPENDELSKDKGNYIATLNYLNNITEELNNYNSRLESQSGYNFADTHLKETIDLETRAKKLDSEIVEKRLALSKANLDFRLKYNVFATSYPEVKSIKKTQIRFAGALNDFLALRDEKIVEAESEIIKLAEETAINKDNPVKVSEIKAQIDLLLKYIEAENSFINRRLVNECRINQLDIVSILKERRENKKEIRERLRKIKEGSYDPSNSGSVPIPNNPKPLAQNKDQELIDAMEKIGIYIINFKESRYIAQIEQEFNNIIERPTIKQALEELVKLGAIANLNGSYQASNMTTEEFKALIEKMRKNEPSVVPQSKEPTPEVKIKKCNLVFNPHNNKQLANRENEFIMLNADDITVSLIKNGLKIKYSEQLRKQLSALNAKLSLVNKNNYRSRTSSMITDTEEAQEIAFHDGRGINPSEYKVEIRVPDESKSTILYEYDLDNISEDLKQRSK